MNNLIIIFCMEERKVICAEFSKFSLFHHDDSELAKDADNDIKKIYSKCGEVLTNTYGKNWVGKHSRIYVADAYIILELTLPKYHNYEYFPYAALDIKKIGTVTSVTAEHNMLVIEYE